jgi:hypothetical protein
MSRLVVVAPLKPGARERARELLAGGPPLAPEGTRFDSYDAFVTEREAVFVFEAAEAVATLEVSADDPEHSQVAPAWRECLAERPRVAVTAFTWKRAAESEGVFFEPTPGPGDSDGGDLY